MFDMAPSALRPAGRDPRLDVFRGFALVTIYINHVPGTFWESFTTRNFGFSDAAEAFVIMSGIAAGLAYAPRFAERPLWPAVARIWHRAGVLYLIHLLTTVLAIAVVAAGAIWLGTGEMLWINNFRPIFTRPLAAQIGIPLMTHQIGYANILPMYAVLLMATPAMILIGRRHPWWLLAGAVALWAAAGTQWINLPNYPNPGGWFFNPLSWQVIFVTGLLTGMAMREGRRLLPVRLWGQLLAAAYLLLALLVLKVPEVGKVFGGTLWQIQEAGAHRLFTAFDKTYLSLPRLLHILALAYLLASLPALRRICGRPELAPLALVGRHALPVFATGTVLAYAAQVVKRAADAGAALDSVLIAGGIVAMLAVAFARDRLGRKGAAAPAAAWRQTPGPGPAGPDPALRKARDRQISGR